MTRRPVALLACWLLIGGAASQVAADPAPTRGRVSDPGGTGAVLIYVDDNDTQVIKTTTSGKATVGPTTTSATVGFDFITSASVDLVTAASPRGFSERRTQAAGSVEHNLGGGSRANGGYSVSHEPDYLTHAISGGGQVELFARHLILSASLGLSWSTVGRRYDTDFERRRQSQDLSLVATRIVTRTLALDLSYTATRVRGFQANAYRFVRLYDPTSPRGDPLVSHLTAVAERVPDRRLRQTAGLRLRWRAAPGWFLHGGYRGYTDTWGLHAHTGTAKVLWSPAGRWSVALRGRGHVQGAARFYRARYETAPQVPSLRTGDKELGPLWTSLVGLQWEWRMPAEWAEAVHLGAGADWLHIRYLDFAFLDQRDALLLTIDLTVEL